MKKAILVCSLAAGFLGAQDFHPAIPRAWDDAEVAAFLVPLSAPGRTPRFVSSKDYYAFRVRPIFRTYPVYVPGKEPAGYFESLLRKDPEIVFDASKLHTRNDWIRAGSIVFHASPDPTPLAQAGGKVHDDPADPLFGFSKSVLDQMLREEPGPVTGAGIVPYLSYVVRKKGLVELDLFTSCASCHTRGMPDGSIVTGAQGNAPIERQLTWLNRWLLRREPKAAAILLNLEWSISGAPWAMSRAEFDKALPIEEFLRRTAAMQPGLLERHGTSSTSPSKVPSLIGLKDIKFLDSTGLMRHRSTGDLMRYAIANYGLDIMAHFGDFQPSPVQTGFAEDGTRFSDEQLFALALYIESLQPPRNPNPFDERGRRGQRIFQQQGCVGCHTPPLYTNNKLTPARGFKIPAGYGSRDDILNVSVGTDPALAMQTRRGTGFYKVPSLRGVWYRNAFGHSGQAETLEEWLDPARLRDDYVPKGFHLGVGPIRGHEFGLKLSPDDKQALIAFLKTL
jgi:hypothetical protein